MDQLEPWALRSVADAAMKRTAADLRKTLRALAASLDPFPSFNGLQTLQAVEVDPAPLRLSSDRGCVVVCPDGELYELELSTLPAGDLAGLDQVERFKPLDLSDAEYVQLAYAAIRALAETSDASAGRPPEDRGT